MAKECLALHLYGMEQDREEIPEPTRALDLRLDANESAVLIDVWMPPFRDYMADKAVKKTLTIPKWLNDAAEEANVNFSHTQFPSYVPVQPSSVQNWTDPTHISPIQESFFYLFQTQYVVT